MRTLIFLFVGLIVFVAVLVSKRIDAKKTDGVTDSSEPEGTSLADRLAEAATTFRASADSFAPKRIQLKTALTDLAAQCSGLSEREQTTGFPRGAQTSIVRLLLALYGVVERLTGVAQHTASEATEAVLESSVGLIVEATDMLHAIADKADETAMVHLEADLDVLRDRLDSLK